MMFAAFVGLPLSLQGAETKVEVHLIARILSDLAQLHNLTHDKLEEAMLDHYSHGWNKHENAMGGFALFSPEQFSNFYPSLMKPTGKGKLNFISEAVSRQHGWVSGSWNTARRVIDNIFNPKGDIA
jgi:monoamine oxidase